MELNRKIKDLPEPYKTKAKLYGVSTNSNGAYTLLDKIPEDTRVAELFMWRRTEEGHDFWRHVSDEAKLPEIPESWENQVEESDGKQRN